MINRQDGDRFVQFVHGYNRGGAALPEERAIVDLQERGGTTEVEPTVTLVGVAREVSDCRREGVAVAERLGTPMRVV